MFRTTIGRRNFLKSAAVTALASPASSAAQIAGAADRIRLGLIGAGDRGRMVMSLFQKAGNVQVAAICDVYGTNIQHALKMAPDAQTFENHQDLLAMKDLDAVLIATPDHWHATIAIDALQAGKDVYIEKPLTLTIDEGPAIVKAARTNGRICQVGMQQRSGPHYIEAKQKYVESGKLGKVTLARTWWHGNGYHLRRAPEALKTKPEDLNWARFLGPAKWRDYDPQQFWNWRAYLDFGGGQITDLFTHWIDVVHMFLGQEIPIAAVASGGVYNYKDGRTAPDTICVLLEYPDDLTATFEATLAPGIRGAGVEFCGTEGKLYIDRQKYIFTPVGRNVKPEEVLATSGDFTLDHVKNFLDAMHTRRPPSGDVLIGHRSAQASHLGNIAYLQKQRIRFDPVREAILPA